MDYKLEFIKDLKEKVNKKWLSGKPLTNDIILLTCLLKAYEYCYQKIVSGDATFNKHLTAILNKLDILIYK